MGQIAQVTLRTGVARTSADAARIVADEALTTADAALPSTDYTAADILLKLLTVDGAGSGIDADLLDGHDASYFLGSGSYTAADVLAKLLTVDGAGSLLDADFLDGVSGAGYLARANHTGTQLAATISDFATAVNLLNAATATKLATGRTIAITGDAAWTSPAFDGSGNVTAALTVSKLNGVSLAGLATGILKNTTGTGAPSIAAAGDFPTLNQNTTGSAATLTTSRNFSIGGGGITAAAVGFNGAAAVVLSASVDAGHITLARMANVATGTIFYRKTAGTGAPEVQTLATLKTDLGLTGTNSGDQTITLTGDVTGGGTGSFAATIGANKVTFAKFVAATAASIVGATGAGNFAELTPAQVLTILGLSGAWTAYSPTVTPFAGTFGSVSAAGAYKQVDKTVHVRIKVTITTNGTAGTLWTVTAPFPSINAGAGWSQSLSAQEVASTGFLCRAQLDNNSSLIYVTKYDNTYIGANGYIIIITGTYECA